MISIARIFGAPVTDPPGNVAPEQVDERHVLPQNPFDRGHAVIDRRMRLDRPRLASPSRVPISHTRPRSLRSRSTIMFSSA